MIPYDVDSIVVGLITKWMDDRLRVGEECVRRARDSETWNPGSKGEPYAQSAVDLMKLTKATVEKLIKEFRRSSPNCVTLPPTTRRWSQSDGNTLLRVLCHRDDEAASRFLKKTFDPPKRR